MIKYFKALQDKALEDKNDLKKILSSKQQGGLQTQSGKNFSGSSSTHWRLCYSATALPLFNDLMI